MFKKKAKAAAAVPTDAAPKKRSKVKLAILAAAPLVLAGGGYGGWVLFGASLIGSEAEAAAAPGAVHGTDDTHVAAIPPEVLAETSATYSFALSELLRKLCGTVKTDALKAASEAEAKADGTLVNLSWMAASRRAGSITEKSCNRILVEIDIAEAVAAKTAAGGETKAH